MEGNHKGLVVESLEYIVKGVFMNQAPPLPNVLVKKIIRYQQELSDAVIFLTTRRTHERKEILLRYECVDCVGNDGKSDTCSVLDLSTQPLQPTQMN